jgi:hypothetical protein
MFPRKSKSSGELSDLLDEIEKFWKGFGFSPGNRKVLQKFQIFSRKLKRSVELSDFLEKVEKFRDFCRFPARVFFLSFPPRREREVSPAGETMKSWKRVSLFRSHMSISYDEKLAKLVIEAALPGSEMVFRERQSRGECDFELRRDGVSCAVEATAAVDQDLEEVNAAITNKRKGGQTLLAQRCKQSWMIYPATTARINDIREKIDDYLAVLEAEDITKFWTPTDLRPTVERIAKDLRVVSGAVLDLNDDRPRIRISLPVTGSAYGASLVNAAVEREAVKKDNRAKLGASGTYERHLAVHVPVLNGAVWCALVDFGPVPEKPKLPTEITDVWVYSQDRGDLHFVAYHASKQSAWSRFEVALTEEQTASVKTAR